MCIIMSVSPFASGCRKTLFILSASLNTSYNSYLPDPQKMNQEGMMVKRVAFINSHLLPKKTTKCRLEEDETRGETLFCTAVSTAWKANVFGFFFSIKTNSNDAAHFNRNSSK